MNKYSERSQKELSTCCRDLKTIFTNVLRTYDHTIIYGRRSKEQQDELYARGRKLEEGEWLVVDKGKIITYKQWPNSKHNVSNPMDLSVALDAAPYINGRLINGDQKKDYEQIYHFVGFVQGVADMLYRQGIVSHKLRSGADWNDNRDIKDQTFNDLMHFELYK